MLPKLDFETYSECGFRFDGQRWRSAVHGQPGGLPLVGSAVYSEHRSTEILCAAYDLKDGCGPRLWTQHMAAPVPLFNYIVNGGIIEAWNSLFEYFIWNNVGCRDSNWPALPIEQTRDTMAKAKAFSLPGKLESASKVLNVPGKNPEGNRLIKKFSVPRSPTKGDKRQRIHPRGDPDGPALYGYCGQDIVAEENVGECCPGLSDFELDVWKLDQKINARGIAIDIPAMRSCIAIVNQATTKYTLELQNLTGDAAQTANELDNIREWIESRGIRMSSLDKDHVSAALKSDQLPYDVRRVLQIRQQLAASSVKKLFAIERRLCADGRLRDLFAYYQAITGRWAGRGPQPQNLTKGGDPVIQCNRCERYCGDNEAGPADVPECRWCGSSDTSPAQWDANVVHDALDVIATNDLNTVELFFGNAIATVSGCLRGLFVAGEGHDLICSDFSAIEAVVLACLAREQWRIDVFRTHGKIYEASASMITGIPLQEFFDYQEKNDAHHPMRNKLGKFAELASGFQGWINAWKQFGADKHMTDDEIEAAVIKWREASPAIVGFWKGLESAAKAAIGNPGQAYRYGPIAYQTSGDVLFCQLPSGRLLSYHSPRLHNTTRFGRPHVKITYTGVDSYTKQWTRLDTYGGKLTENVVQATARDLQAHAMLNLDRAGYPIVIHVHDEVGAEIPAGTGSIEHFESVMAQLPDWASDWPVKVSGGWIGKRYRKD